MTDAPSIARRFRGFLPVVVDVECGGFNPVTDALLEIAVVIVDLDASGNLVRRATHSVHVDPFPGARIEPAALELTGIKIDHPFRMAVPEREALEKVLKPVRQAVSERGCTRALLVGHNAHFDLSFVNAACARTNYKRNPFHPFSVFDTATLGGALLGQTVLKRALDVAGIGYDSGEAHSAIYDAERTADLFCLLINQVRPVYEAFAARLPPAEPAEPLEPTLPPEAT
jgi:ribonuclease T